VVMEGISDLETMEAIACREGLALASDILFQRLRLACDCVTSSGTSMEPTWEYMVTLFKKSM
jgi:hypothetical protein